MLMFSSYVAEDTENTTSYSHKFLLYIYVDFGDNYFILLNKNIFRY